MEFIFMLTQNDVTAPTALELLEEVKEMGLRCVGCKDVGLDLGRYRELFRKMKNYDMKSFLEVVTYDENEHFRGVDLARKIGADYLIGGMPQYTEKTLGYLRERKSKLKCFPYIGEVVDHPCVLQGSIDHIIEDGEEAENMGVDGVNLLLYRYRGDQRTLLNEVTKNLRVPLIVAGSIRNFEQIQELKRKNIWAFTVGGAIFERKFVIDKGVREQITAILSKL